jgi:hypothetical protein
MLRNGVEAPLCMKETDRRYWKGVMRASDCYNVTGERVTSKEL